MRNYYFIFNPKPNESCRYPYARGYTRVEAKDMYDASNFFRAVHPDDARGELNCTYVLTEDEFNHSQFRNSICVEEITLNIVKKNFYECMANLN